MSAPVVLINAFTVPVDESERFLDRWRDNARAMSGRPGFRRARMHRARHDDAELRFVNVAEWDSEDAWREAQVSPEFRAALQRMLADPELHVTARPAIYDVVVDVPADPT
jgi:heme-degrading monooxygenase HmoA